MKREKPSFNETALNGLKETGREILRVLPSGWMGYLFIFIVTFVGFLYLNPEIKNEIDVLVEPYRIGIWNAFNLSIIVTAVYISILIGARVLSGNYIHGAYGERKCEGSTRYTALSAACIKPLSDERIRRVSCHEAGHLLALACFGEPPKSLTIEIKKYQAPYLGTLTYDVDEDFLCSMTGVESAMKVSLAGAIAEEIIYGDCLVGQQLDNEKWEKYCRTWLASFTHQYQWFICPSTESEALVNAKTLKSIKNEHTQKVSDLLIKNTDLLIEATDIIKSEMVSGSGVLMSLLKRVEI